MNHPIHCGNCQWTGDLDGDDYIPLERVRRLGERISPGCETPAGECPNCGCLVFVGRPPAPRMTVSTALEVVRGVINDTPYGKVQEAFEIISSVFAKAKKTFRCPWCGSSHFGSKENADKTLTRVCHGCVGHEKFSWHESEDPKYFRWVIELSSGEIRDRPKEVSTKVGKTKVLAIYHHRHGQDIISFTTSKNIGDLTSEEVAKAIGLDWEPERDEWMEFQVASVHKFPDIDDPGAKPGADEFECDRCGLIFAKELAIKVCDSRYCEKCYREVP